MKKVKDLLKTIRTEANIYDALVTPQASLTAYQQELLTPKVEEGTYAPDQYGGIDWAKDAFTDWAIKRNEVNSDTSRGKVISLNEDVDTFDKAAQYVEAHMNYKPVLDALDKAAAEGKDTDLIAQEYSKISEILSSPEHKLAYDKVATRKTSSLTESDIDFNFSKRDPATLLGEINKYKDDAIAKQVKFNLDASAYDAAAQKWREKHQISDYYNAKSLKEGFDLTSVDTYLFKVPGLMGSSASSMLSQAASMAGGVLAAGALTTAAGAAAVGTGGAATPLAIAMTAAAGSIAADTFSRSEESFAEVYQHYKDNVKNQSQKDKSLDKAIGNAKIQLKELGVDPNTVPDDKIVDMLLTNKLQSGNEKFDRNKVGAINGLESLYSDNMALSGSDIVLTAISVMPFGAMSKAVKGVKTLGKAASAAAKAKEAVSGIPAQLGNRIDDVVIFGMTNAKRAMNVKTATKAVREIGGKLVLTSAMEGAEEGVQYIKGKEYLQGEYDVNPNLLKSWAKNLGTQARALYAAITPFDLIYSTDAQFMENFKGGALLGGLMTGVTIGVQEAANSAAAGKTSIGRQMDANKFAAALYAERVAEKDLFNKNMQYSKAVRESSKQNIDDAFDMLSLLKVEGVDQKSVLLEKERANRVMAQSESPANKKIALSNGIDPRTEDYDIFVSLQEHYRDRYKDAISERSAVNSEIESVLGSVDWDMVKLPDGVDRIEYQAAAVLKAKKEALDKILNQYQEDLGGLDKVLRATNLTTNKADLVKSKQVLSDILEDVEWSLKIALGDKLAYDLIGIPGADTKLEDALEKLLYVDIDVDRNRKELELLTGVYTDKVGKVSIAKQKVELYKKAAKQEDVELQMIQDEARGVAVESAPEEEVKPAPITFIKHDKPIGPQKELFASYNIPRTQLDVEPKDISEFRLDVQKRISDVSINEDVKVAENALKLLYDGIKSMPGIEPLTKGYTEFAAQTNLDKLVIDEDDDTNASRWLDLKGWKDKLEEAIVSDDKLAMAKYSFEINQIVSEINSEKEADVIKKLNDISLTKAKDIVLVELISRPTEATPQVAPPSPLPEIELKIELAQPLIEELLVLDDVQQAPVKLDSLIDYNIPLQYDRSRDAHSHQLNYWVNRQTNEPFLGYESWYERSDAFSKVSALPDFVTNSKVSFNVKDYTDKKGVVSKAIYAEFEYKGKNYVAAVADPTSLRNYVSRNKSFELTNEIISNLNALRNKILDLHKATKPGVRVVPTLLERTKGRIINLKNEDGSPKNQKLTDTGWINKNPMYITPENTQVGISTGTRGNQVVRCGQQIFAGNGTALGLAYWFVDEKPILLNTKKFAGDTKVVDTIYSMLTADPTKNFVNSLGEYTSFKPSKLLELIANFGPQTAVNPQDRRLSQDLILALTKKLFYIEDSKLFLGDKVYTISDMLSNKEVEGEIKQYILDNMHWNIDEDALNKWYLGQPGFSKENPFSGMKDWFELNKKQKMVVIPGVLEFDMADAGLLMDGDRVVLNKQYPKGLSMLGWYIREGILQTDFGGYQDANIYVADVKLEDTSVEKQVEAAIKKQDIILLTKTEDLKNLPDIGLAFAELGPLKTVDKISDSKLATELAKVWLLETLGLAEDLIDITESAIDILKSGLTVVGRSKLDAIQLSELAPEGTQYHEAWHRVSNLMISESKRRQIYDKYNSKLKQKLSDVELDEIFADNFTLFLLDSAPLIDFKVTSWFRKIANFIKIWSKVGNMTLAKLYYDINSGKYANARASLANIERFKSLYSESGPNFTIRGQKFKTINNTSTYNDILDSLTYLFFYYNDIRDYNDIDKLSKSNNDGFARLKLQLQAWEAKLPNNDAVKEINEKYDNVFAPALSARLKTYNTSVFERTSLEDSENADAGEVDGVNIGEHTIASYEVSKRDNAPAEVKFFFQTIPSYAFNEDGLKTVEIEPNTGFPKFVDPRKAWNTVLIDLHDISDLNDLVLRVNKFAETSLFYAAVARKLLTLLAKLNSDDKTISSAAETALTRLENTLLSHKHAFVTGKVSRNDAGLIEVGIKDNTVDTKAIQYPKIWSASLFYNINKSGVFKQNTDGMSEITENGKDVFQQFITNFSILRRAFVQNKGVLKIKSGEFDLHEEVNLNRAKKLIVDMLNSVGISIDVDTIDEVLKSGLYGDYHKLSSYLLLNNFILNTNVYGGLQSISNVLEGILNQVKFAHSNKIDLIDVFGKDNKVTKVRPIDLWNNRGWVKMIALSYASVHANADELRSLGADGNSLYPISQNNFASDLVNRLNKDSEYVEKLRSVVFNQGSLILSNINVGETNLQLETFVNFKDDTAFDVGRDYFQITDREDYIAKMAMIFENRIIFPTVADKKTYHMIRGIELPHERIEFKTDGNSQTAVYGDATLNQFMKYFDAEVAAIELCMRLIDDTVDANGNHNPDWVSPERRVKNYHTGNKKYGPNGVHFRLITGLYYTVNGKELFVNFNDPNLTPRLNLDLAKAWLLNPAVSADVKKQFLSSTLSKAVANEVLKAKQLGLIKANESNDIYSIENVLLDLKQLNLRKAEYMKSDDPIVQANASGYAAYDMIADYTLNSIISLVEVEKLFSGDPAYYKYRWSDAGIVDMSIDKIKRLGALTSTGLNNRLDFGTRFTRPDYSVAELNDYEIGSKQFDVIEQLFVDGSIYDFVRVYHGDSAIYNEDGSFKPISELKAADEYKEAIDAAILQAKIESKGYKDGINVADAAVYVSPNMYRDMMRMIGQWSNEVDEAFEILTNPESSRLWESDPVLYKKVLKASLKPLKYMAFGLRLSEIPGLAIPYFNKMALFPLFESVATGDMKPLYERMTNPENPLDMVMFNSAVKAGSVGAMDYYDGDNVTNLNKLVVYRLGFENLRLQLATDPHTHEEQMAGTQMLKVGLSNIHDSDQYGFYDKISGAELKRQVFDTMNALSNIGASKLKSEYFDDGGFVNKVALYQSLKKDAADSDANDNIVSGLSLDDNGKPLVPLAACSDNSFVESRFISMINKKTIDIDLPGGSFIQRSTFGLEATSLSVITDNMLNDGKRLNLVNEDGSMDSIVSINLFKHIIPNYKNMTLSEAKDWLVSHDIIGVMAKPSAIGYRIPTQAIASISSLRFVDVLPEIMGDTIVLPEEFTKLTGSDFDVDKLFVARYQYRDGAKIQMSESISIDEQDEYALKNHLIDMYMAVLTTKEHGNELKISIDNATENVKAILRDIESNRKTQTVSPFSIYTPSYQEDRKLEYTGGKAGIGPMALNNAHHILTLLLNPKFASNPITETLGLIDTNKIYDDATTFTKKGGRVLDWLSAMINGFVDIAKDPYIIRLNVNPWTYNMVTFLLRTGKGKLTFYFMSQPILKEMAEAVSKTKGKYGIDQTKTASLLEKQAMQSVLDKYDPTGNLLKQYRKLSPAEAAAELSDLFLTYEDIDGNETSRARLLILGDRGDVKNFDLQLIRMYYAFETLKPYADDLANLVKYSKVDTKKMGKSFIEQRDFLNGMVNLTQDSNFAFDEVSRFYNESFLQTKTENSIVLGSSIFAGELYRTSAAFTTYQDGILEMLSRKNMAGQKLLGSLTKAIEADIKSEFFNKKLMERGLSAKDLLYGDRSIAKRLLAFKQLIYQGQYPDLLDSSGNISNDFLDYLLPNINSGDIDTTLPDFIDTTALFTEDKVQADNLINYWNDLLEHEKPEVKRIAEDLVLYAFITSGDNSNANSFFNYVPNTWRINSGYVNFTNQKLAQMLSENGLSYMDIDDLFKNNWYNDQMVKPYLEAVPVAAKELELDDRGMPVERMTSFVAYDKFSDIHDRNIPAMILGKRNDRSASKEDIRAIGYKLVFRDGKILHMPVFPPYIKIKVGKLNSPKNNILYQLVGYTEEVQGSRQEIYPIYTIRDKKGMKYKGHVVTEYNRSDGFPFNHLPISYDAGDALKSGTIYQDIWESTAASDKYKEYLLKQFTGARPIGDLYISDYDKMNTEDDLMLPEEPKAVSAESKEDGGIDFGDVYDSTPVSYVNHSGGAIGADSAWGSVGEKYGVKSNHYYLGDKTPSGNVEITEVDATEGAEKVASAAAANYGYKYKTMKNTLLIRNWAQVKYSDAIFAIATMVKAGEPLFPNITGDTRKALHPAVTGGTGYAVEMAIQAGKPVYVFDQSRNRWFSNINGVWSTMDEIPTLTQNFAGIGSRYLTESGKKAITDVYNKTFGEELAGSDSSQFNNEDEFPSDIKDKCKGK